MLKVLAIGEMEEDCRRHGMEEMQTVCLEEHGHFVVAVGQHVTNGSPIIQEGLLLLINSPGRP